MLVVDSWSERGSTRDADVPFEGFLEALCRLAVLKALPTDEQISADLCADAGAYLQKLLADDETAHDLLIARNAVAWGEPPRQPVHRCVAHMLSVVLRRLMDPSAAAVYHHPTAVGAADIERHFRENRAAYVNQLGLTNNASRL